MPRWEGRRYRLPRVSISNQVGGVYDLAKAREAHAKMQVMSSDELYAKLQTPGQVCDLPYPGIGVPPRRPGGDLKFAARAQMLHLVELFIKVDKGRGGDHTLYVTGPKGMGKSCFLRGLAWILFLMNPKKFKVICLWSMQSAYKRLLAEVKAALSFTYCKAQDVLEEIASLTSLEDVERLMDRRMDLGEAFYFIVDGAEVLDSITSKGTPRPNKDIRAAVDTQLSSLLRKARVSIIAVSPMADSSRKREANSSWVYFDQGFWKEEYDAYISKASVLGRLPHWQEEIDYYADVHPLSLSVLDSCCRYQAEKRWETQKRQTDDSDDPIVSYFKLRRLEHDQIIEQPMDEEKIAELLKDEDEWDEAVKLFVSSAEMASIRVLLHETLSSLSSSCHSQVSMMEQDTRFVVGDPRSADADYVTPYIRRMYIEGFREAESRRVYEKTAWQHYCRYLLDQGGPINWAEMGWLVKNLAAEVIGFRGLNLDGMSICTARTQRFGGVPNYESWISEVQAGGAIYFIPLKYNYRSVDGLVVWQHASGTLHLIAIQVTVNDQKHQICADEFMSFNTIINWIPEEHLNEWKLHFVFLCTRSLPAKQVPEHLLPLRSGGQYGNVKYSLHTISIEDGFRGSVSMDTMQTLKDVARHRDEASEPAAEKTIEAEAKAISDALADGPPPPPGVSPQAIALVRNILSRSEFTRQKLENIAKHHQIAVSLSDTKSTLISKMCKSVLQL